MRDEAGVEVYPNPTQDKLHIHLSTLTETRIVLYNVLGEEVYTGTSNGKETELSLAALPQGLYFLIVKTKENRIFTEKVIKQ
jgi:hypothetical protein